MNYAYKSFTFICLALSVVTKEIVTKKAPNNSIELFNNILYQRNDKVDNDIEDIYSAWSIIKNLIITNRTFLYRPYDEILNNVLYDNTEFQFTENLDVSLLKDLKTLISNNKEKFKTFYDTGASRYLNELISN